MNMKGKMLAAILTFLFIAYLVVPVHAAQKGQKMPKVFIPNKNAMVGEVLEGEDIEHTYVIKNLGDSELQIVNVRPG